jgi:microcystin-dependent protein
MAYQIRFTDQINNPALQVDDNTTNQVTSLQFPGRNTTGYGQAIGENFLHLLENFANTTAPANPVKGQCWYDTNAGIKQLNVYDGTQWVAAGGLKKSSGVQPDAANSLPGDLWVNTDTQQLFLFSGSGWILVGPRFSSGARTGAEPESFFDTDNIERIVISNFVNGARVAIFSVAKFQPKTTIPGFTTVYPGVTLSSLYNGYYGTAEKAQKLIVTGYSQGLEADNFLRADVVTNNYKGLNVKSNTGIQVGEDGQLELKVDGGIGAIYQKTSGSSLDIRVNNNGTERAVIRIDSQERVGINNISPQEALDVIGNLKLSPTTDNPDTTGRLFVYGTENSLNTVSGTIVTTGGVGVLKNIYAGGSITAEGSITIGSNSGSTLQKILPVANKRANIGDSANVFNEVWADKFYTTASGAFVGNLTGSVTGSVTGSASRLSSATIFDMDGDVSSTAVEFDGKTGVNTVTTATSTGNGTEVTLTYPITYLVYETNEGSVQEPFVAFPVGSIIEVTDIRPATYQGTFTVLRSTTNSVTYSSTATGVQQQPGKISPKGVVGNRKQFITTLKETFIKDKIKATTINEEDEFLISQGSSGLRRISKGDLWTAIPQLPVGAVMPYAGLTPPMGWLLCDGSEVQRTRYPALYAVIKDLYGSSEAYIPPTYDNNGNMTDPGNPNGTQGYDTFKLPDMRSRFPLGPDNMFNGKRVKDRDDITSLIDTIDPEGAGRISDPNAAINYTTPEVRVGSGSEKVTLELNNLPDHEHDLRGESGGQFGAFSDQLRTDADAIPVQSLGGATAEARLLQTSGGMKDNNTLIYDANGKVVTQSFSVMNPFLAMNYIIWTGKLSDLDEDYV